ncbi:MAG: hypothetical protein D6698_08970 [Gammaproteobacteria bacterium]|nr:MAG: hypothetical protein D6698_08970 [Gammaproteobacteria bacterium]
MTCTKRTKVKDKDFPSSNRLNKLKCVASDRYLKKVEERVNIVNICQDELNPSLVVIDFELNGVFNYTPTCLIRRVDTDGSYKDKKVVAPLLLSYPKSNPTKLPINTNCKTQVFTLAFDFAAVIPNFLSAKEIEIELKMDGTLPPSLKIPDFRRLDKTISHVYRWIKGPTPQFVAIRYNKQSGKLEFIFQFDSGFPCSCNIQCETLSGSIGGIQYCKDKRSRVIVDYTPDNNPQVFSLQLKDALGNTTDISLSPLVELKPLKPTVSVLSRPRRVEVGISKQSVLGADFSDHISAVQVWRYQGTPSNAKIWRDWNDRDSRTLADTDVIPYSTYGYAVMFRGRFGETSLLSDWAVVNT